jgi:hypothetical protein
VKDKKAKGVLHLETFRERSKSKTMKRNLKSESMEKQAQTGRVGHPASFERFLLEENTIKGATNIKITKRLDSSGRIGLKSKQHHHQKHEPGSFHSSGSTILLRQPQHGLIDGLAVASIVSGILCFQ